jgi:hypothetical protein
VTDERMEDGPGDDAGREIHGANKGFEAEFSAPAEPAPLDLDQPPIDPDGDDDPDEELAKLKLAEESSKRAEPLKDRYMEVIKLLSKDRLTSGQYNDLGCAWAWRAHLEKGGFAYWSRAVEALKAAAQDAKTKPLASANLAIVYRVSGLE